MATAGYEGGYNWEWSTQQSEMTEYTAGYNNHLVVFDVHTYDRYTYEVVTHPNPDIVDELIDISVPSGVKRTAVSLDFFNTLFDDIKIDESIVSAVPGNLETYPTKAGAESIIAGLPDKPLYGHLPAPGETIVIVPVESTISPSQGDANPVTYSFSRSDGLTYGSEHGFYVGIDAQVCILAICGGAGASYGWNWSYMYGVSDDLAFGVTLGSIREDYFENLYRAGLFAYTYKMDNQHFTIVNFFVE